MKIGKRLILIGVIVLVLSMTMATQYVTTKVSYTYSIVHPSDSDIRFIASDNSSDGIRILRISGDNSSGNQALQLKLGGNISAGQNKTYTAAFGIVNEEKYPVNITHVRVAASSGADYLQIWLHGDRDAMQEDDASAVKVWDKGSVGAYDNSSSVWILGAGNADSTNMDADNAGNPSSQLDTLWDTSANVRYSNCNNNSVSGQSDFVWVQISIDAASNAPTASYTGDIYIYTRAGA